MRLTYGFLNVCDLYGKLKRDAAALEDEITSDRFFNFVLTGYSMIDWIKNDPSITPSARESTVVGALYADKSLKICGDIATASKHFELKKRHPITTAATSESGFGMGRFGVGGYGAGEECLVITLNNGESIECLELVNGVKATWQKFFTEHEICHSSD